MTVLTNNSSMDNLAIIKQCSAVCFIDYPILQTLTLCQAIEESNLLHHCSRLALVYSNLFGMKPGSIIPRGTSTVNDGIVNLNTHECDKYGCEEIEQPFLSNASIEDSFKQHEELFRQLNRYSNLFKAQSLDEAARMVQADGYATDPNYADNLIRIYNQYVKV